MDRQLILTYEKSADTPEDAAAMLAIEPFKAGVASTK